MANRMINIDVYDLTEERVEAAVAVLRTFTANAKEALVKCEINRATFLPGQLEMLKSDLAAMSDALTICQSASLSFAEPVHVGTERHTTVRDMEGFKATAEREPVEAPVCRFCGVRGREDGGRRDKKGSVVEPYFVCDSKHCIMHKSGTPQPRRDFEGGAK